MSRPALPHEALIAAVTPMQTGAATWMALCPRCGTPHDGFAVILTLKLRKTPAGLAWICAHCDAQGEGLAELRDLARPDFRPRSKAWGPVRVRAMLAALTAPEFSDAIDGVAP